MPLPVTNTKSYSFEKKNVELYFSYLRSVLYNFYISKVSVLYLSDSTELKTTKQYYGAPVKAIKVLGYCV